MKKSNLLEIAHPYLFVQRLRRELYKKSILGQVKFNCPVLSVGNLTFGGTGKTPIVLGVAQAFQNQGKNVLVLTRGYHSEMEKIGGVLKCPQHVDASVWGDEPAFLASLLEGVTLGVGADRVDVYEEATIGGFEYDLVILEDGFQHLKIKRDLDLILMDASKNWGRELQPPPLGRLRESVATLGSADAVLLTRVEDDSDGKLSMLRELYKYSGPAFEMPSTFEIE